MTIGQRWLWLLIPPALETIRIVLTLVGELMRWSPQGYRLPLSAFTGAALEWLRVTVPGGMLVVGTLLLPWRIVTVVVVTGWSLWAAENVVLAWFAVRTYRPEWERWRAVPLTEYLHRVWIPGTIPARYPPLPLPAAESHLEPLDWADFWAWAIPQGYHGRIDIEATLQFSTAGMAPIVIKAALEEHQRTVPPAPSLMRRLRPEQSPPDTATQAGIADTFGWTEFWAWARLRGYHSRADLDSALDRSTSAMTPWEIREVLEGRLSVEDVPARPTRPDDDSPF